MRGSRKFCQRGLTLTTTYEDGIIQIPLWVVHHLIASETPFKWRFDDVQTMNAGLVAL